MKWFVTVYCDAFALAMEQNYETSLPGSITASLVSNLYSPCSFAI